MNLFSWTALAVLAASLAGCGSYRTGPVGQTNAGAAAILDVKEASPAVFVHSIDGQSLGFGLFNQYEIPPGRRVITVFGNTQSGLYLNPTNVVLTASPRGHYVLVRQQTSTAREWRVKIVDAVSGERVDSSQFPAKCSRTWTTGYECSAEP